MLIPYRRQAADFIHGFAVILRVAFLYYEPKNPRSSERGFFICVHGHNIILSVAKTSLPLATQMNDVALCETEGYILPHDAKVLGFGDFSCFRAFFDLLFFATLFEFNGLESTKISFVYIFYKKLLTLP